MRLIGMLLIACGLPMGLYLLFGGYFFMPSRSDPSIGMLFNGSSAKVLGIAMLALIPLGFTSLRLFNGEGAHRDARWLRHFMLSLLLFMAALLIAVWLAEPVSDTEYHKPLSANAHTTNP